jgi:hypothetical protein
MAYTINLTSGNLLTTIADGTVNSTSTPLTLVGKNYAGYGAFLNTDLVHLLENFNNDTAPTTPLEGQLWWNSSGLGGNLQVRTGTNWRTLGSITANSIQPSAPVVGNAWWDTAEQQFKVYNGTGWTLIGPAFTSNVGQSGFIVGTIVDSDTNNHVAVNVYVQDTLISILSKDSEYTPQSVISGFTTIKPGYNLSTVGGIKFVGTATNSDALGSIAAANFARTDQETVFNDIVRIATPNGIKIGTTNNFIISQTGTLTTLYNNILNANTAIVANVGGTAFNAITINGQTGSTTIANLSTSGAFVTTGFIQTTQGDNATSNSSGAIRVLGGIGLTGNIFTSNSITAEGNVIVSGRVTSGGNISTAGFLFVTGTEDATSNTTGAVRISGGMSVQGNVRVVANIRANNFIGSAITALYSDLAERFEADNYYKPGTVLTIGGTAEVTVETEELSEDVFGVVSTQYGYLMNGAAGSDETHPPIAVSGRVPVKVIGKVRKGDRLVSAGNGLARAGSKQEINAFNVIGRSLENKFTEGEGMVLAIVTLNS